MSRRRRHRRQWIPADEQCPHCQKETYFDPGQAYRATQAARELNGVILYRCPCPAGPGFHLTRNPPRPGDTHRR